MTRIPLPNKRLHIVERIDHAGVHYHVGYGFDSDGCVREVFADARKTGSDTQATLSDACIMLSLLLQHGMSIADIAAALGENRAEGASSGDCASVLGIISRAGVALEQGGVRVWRVE